MAKTRIWIVALGLWSVAGCQDQNSPDMGAVPPKPRPEVIRQIPESARSQIEGAKEREKAAAQEMGSRMPSAAQTGVTD